VIVIENSGRALCADGDCSDFTCLLCFGRHVHVGVPCTCVVCVHVLTCVHVSVCGVCAVCVCVVCMCVCVQGAGRLMGASFLRLARDLGYKLSYFNLVFASNPDSVRLWDGLGFTRVAVLPRAANLKGIQNPVTAYGYHYDLTTLPLNFDAPRYAAQKPFDRRLIEVRRVYERAAPALLPACMCVVLALLFAVIKK